MKEQKKLLIGVDKDDVLVDFNTRLAEYHNTHYGSNYRIEDLTSYYLHETWQCTQEVALERVVSFYNSVHFDDLEPVPDAKEVLRRLKKKANLLVITARPDYTSQVTTRSLEKYYPGLFDGVIFTGTFTGDGPKKTKADVCEELGVDVMIDDHYDNLTGCADRGIKSILLRRPWNKKHSDEEVGAQGIIPVHSWLEVPKHIK